MALLSCAWHPCAAPNKLLDPARQLTHTAEQRRGSVSTTQQQRTANAHRQPTTTLHTDSAAHGRMTDTPRAQVIAQPAASCSAPLPTPSPATWPGRQHCPACILALLAAPSSQSPASHACTLESTVRPAHLQATERHRLRLGSDSWWCCQERGCSHRHQHTPAIGDELLQGASKPAFQCAQPAVKLTTPSTKAGCSAGNSSDPGASP